MLDYIEFFGARNRNRTGMQCLVATDFKSVVSTNFTTRADVGGETQNRTGIGGFAIRCITILLSRHVAKQRFEMNKGKRDAFP